MRRRTGIRAFERRATGAYPFFKLGVWDETFGLYRAGKVPHASEEAARGAAKRSGRYKITRFDDGSNHDLPPFTV